MCISAGGEPMGWVYATRYVDGGEILDTDPNYGRAFPCACRTARAEQRYREFLWREADLPAGEWRFTEYRTDLEPLPEERRQALRAATDWASGQGERPWLVLYGPNGTGKTHLAAAAVGALVGAGVHAVYSYVPDLIDRLRAGQGDGSYGETVEQLRNVPALVLDDLNATPTTDWAEGEILKLVDWRYRQRGSLLVTTNALYDAMEPRLRDRLFDRLMSRAVLMAWPSYRTGEGAA